METQRLWNFQYNDKDRWLFVTEQSDSYVAGFEIPKSNLGLSTDLKDIYQLLNEDQKSFTEELSRFKESYKGTVAFKKFIKANIIKLKRM
jgi:hypothetical protein